MKNLRKNSLLLLVALLGYTAGKAQKSVSAFKRPLGTVPAGWRKIVLPNALFGKVSDNFSDVRILGIATGGDTLEAPYVVFDNASGYHTHNGSCIFSFIERIGFGIQNSTHNSKGYYYTFPVLPTGELVNEIQLQVANTNFDWRVQLEGSNTQMEWFTILDDYRILDIKNAQTEFQFTTLHFPNARYRYLRLLIKNPAATPQKLKASYTRLVDTIPVQFQQYQLTSQTRTEDKALKQTILQISLPQPLPVSQILLPVTEAFDYYRPVTIEALNDSFKTPNGWRYNWSPVYSGTLNSIDKSAFEFSSIVTQRLRITLENGDNRPLHIGDAKVTGLIYTLFARFDEPADYFLVYGNENAVAPDYDIARFSDKIPANPPALAVGDEVAIDQVLVPPAEPLFQNRLWLWAVIVGIGLLLGVATLRMLRKG